MKHEQGYTDGGANPHYDGLFDGETDADKERRIQWAINEDQLPWPGMMTAFENYYGQSWFDRDWRDETAIWAAAWKAAKTHNAEIRGGEAVPLSMSIAMTKMRAKMQVTGIEVFSNSEGATTGERLYFRAVANCPYPADGSDENNTYAKFSPDASLSIYVANPALFGQFKTGEAYYVDFTPAP